MRKVTLIIGMLLLFAAEILRVYFIMPFPGSQQSDSIGFAYWLGMNITWIRILLLLTIAYPVYHTIRQGNKWKTIGIILLLVIYAVIFYFVNFRFEADKMFYQPTVKTFYAAGKNRVDSNKLVIGVVVNGEAKAYPIEVIGYHHQVRDTIGGKPAMITYCTVCRTGRVFSPEVNGKLENFRLVGMDHFNAMFEDETTKSWWQQATGVAISGKLRGTVLPEIPSSQMSLKSWLRLNPSSTILQPDTVFYKKYEGLKGYDNGSIKGGLEHRDSLSWNKKSWVIGISNAAGSKAYDWNQLVKHQLIHDSNATIPVLLVLEDDGQSFHVFETLVDGRKLQFRIDHDSNGLVDLQTSSTWSMNGVATEGPLKGQSLRKVAAYQEFWHSWKQFHPRTEVFK